MTEEQWGRRVRSIRMRIRRARAAALAASALLIVGLAALAAGAAADGSTSGGNVATVTLADRTLPGSRLDLATDSADVNVHVWNRPGIHVTAIERGGRRGDTVEVSLVGDTVRVRQHLEPCFSPCTRDLRYDVSAPARAAAKILSSSGRIDVDGLGGGLTIGTASGDVTLHDVGGHLDANTASGNVVLGAGRVTGATVRTSSGDIELAGVAGTLDLHSASGSITVRDARDGALAIATASGDIDYTGSLATRGSDMISSASGSVTLRLPAGSRFQLDASTASGGLHDGFGLRDSQQNGARLSGTAGDGSARLRITTDSGDIAVNRA
jgi:DUF4097 and DUF4098 domain-containing protein YvlB